MCSVLLLILFVLMIRRPPRSTRTDTLFPYATLFRSVRDWTDHLFARISAGSGCKGVRHRDDGHPDHRRLWLGNWRHSSPIAFRADDLSLARSRSQIFHKSRRSEERRVGTECVSQLRSRWAPDH